ncbi:MAG: Lrp/AsnC family transcriptional regulator [Bacteroidia bacterium]|nr:Lrp/AsnC family transcriptional regulator [Bacteroidia bacterium]
MKDNILTMDEIDLKILDLLQDDGKLTTQNLADRIGLSKTAVYDRVRKLEKNGTIQKYVAILNSKAVNRNLLVYTMLTLENVGDIGQRNTREQLLEISEIEELLHTGGPFNFILKIRVSDIQSYRKLLMDRIAIIANVKEVTSHFVLEVLKSTTKIELGV